MQAACMSSTPPPPPPPRRALYQRTATGLYVSDLSHPLLPGKRLRLSAPSQGDLVEQKRLIDELARQYRHGALTLAEFRDRLARFEAHRAPALSLREAWDTYTATARPSMLSKLGSIWRKQIAGELGELAVVHLTARRLEQWENAMIAEGYAPKTTRDAFMLLAAAVRCVLPDGEDLPWRLGRGKYWRPKRAPHVVSPRPAICTVDEAERLIHAALEEDRAQRAGTFGQAYSRRLADLGPRAAVVLLLALRNGEGSGLGWDDFAFGAPIPFGRIQHQATDQWRKHHPEWSRPLDPPKGGRIREVTLHPTAILALRAQRELLEERGWYRDDGPVFPGHEGNAFAGTWRNNANCIRPEDLKRLAGVAGLPFPNDWVTHSLRHSLATVEHHAGADLRSIQDRTGHGSLRQLEEYIHAKTRRGRTPSAIREFAIAWDLEHDTEKDLTPLAEEDPES
jgi:integrase